MGAPLDLAPYLWPDAAAGRLPASRSSAALRDDGPTAGWIGWDAKTDLFGAPVSIGTSGDAHCYTGPAGDFIQTASGTNRVVQFGGSFAVPADKSILVVARCDTIPSGLDAVVALTGNVADPEGGYINQWGGQIGVSSAGNVRIGDYDGSVRFATAGGGAVSAGQWFCAAGAVRSGVGLIAAKDGLLGTQASIGTAQSNAAWSLLCNVKDQYSFMAEQFPGAVAMVLWWPRALSNDELVAYTANPALALPVPHLYLPMGAAGGSSFSLTVQDASHSHAVDSLVLSSALGLTVQDAAHAHASDSLTLSAALALAVADAIHGHAADNLALSTGLALSVFDAVHGHTADAPTLSAALALVVADAAHGHSADSLTLDTGTALVIADALHSHTADSPALSSALSLLIADATHGHGADAITLTTALSLVIADALHSHAAENIDLVAGAQLAIQGAGHGHTAESLVLSQALSLAINNALHAHAADAPALTEALTLAINDALHAHGADNIVWPGQGAANLLRVASVYVRLMGQHPFVRIEENTEYLRIGNPAQTVRAN